MSREHYSSLITGDSCEVLKELPPFIFDMIFADPPYNLGIENKLTRPDGSEYNSSQYDWDKFSSFEEYDEFCSGWLSECKRTLKDSGSIFVTGTYHNIFRIGTIMLDLGFWILNDIVWIKPNPTPQFRGVRLAHGHELIIWASRSKECTYKFFYQRLKKSNNNKQVRAEWTMSYPVGNERIFKDGKRFNITQKPEQLVYRCMMATTDEGDLICDPFVGTGTTVSVAKAYKRDYVGIDIDPEAIDISRQRLENTAVKLF